MKHAQLPTVADIPSLNVTELNVNCVLERNPIQRAPPYVGTPDEKEEEEEEEGIKVNKEEEEEEEEDDESEEAVQFVKEE